MSVAELARLAYQYDNRLFDRNIRPAFRRADLVGVLLETVQA